MTPLYPYPSPKSAHVQCHVWRPIVVVDVTVPIRTRGTATDVEVGFQISRFGAAGENVIVCAVVELDEIVGLCVRYIF